MTATKKKTEEEEVKEEKKYKVEDLYKLEFVAEDGTILMVRRAYRPRGKLEFYAPRK